MTAEFLGEKTETCTPDTIRTLLATLKKLQDGLYAMSWIREDMVPQEWQIGGRNPPRGPYASEKRKPSANGLRRETLGMAGAALHPVERGTH